MRLGDYCKALHKVIRAQGNRERMARFASDSFKGGWEVWLQCETFAEIPDNQQYLIEREVRYPNPYGQRNRKCDFRIEKQGSTPVMWAELKVQLGSANNTVSDLVKRFAKDVAKLQGLKPRIPDPANSAIALGLVVHDANLLTNVEVREQFSDITGLHTDRIGIYSSASAIASSDPWGANNKIEIGSTVFLAYSLHK